MDQLDELLEFLPLDPSHFGLPSDAGDVDFVTALGVENAHLHKIVPLESGEKLVAASIIVYCQLELSVNWKSRWAAFEFGDSTRDVQDLERSLGVNVELTVNSANTEISSIYIRGVELPLLRDVVEDRSELFSR